MKATSTITNVLQGFYNEYGSGEHCHPEDGSSTFLPNVSANTLYYTA
jgi:hypothetical protein